MSMRCTWSPSFNCLVRAGNQGIACSQISLAIWFKWDDTAANYEAIEINGSAGGFFAACIEIASGDITFHVTNADGSSRISVVGPAYSAGTWKHGALTYDNTTLTGYVDGASVGTATGLGGSRGNWQDLQIGPGVGELQDAFFYERAISADEVVAKYRGRTPKNPQNLRHWLPLHTGSNRLVDYSGNALNFSNSGTPVDGTTVPPVGWGAGRTRLILPQGSVINLVGGAASKTSGAATITKDAALSGAALSKTAGSGAITVTKAESGAALSKTSGAATMTVTKALTGAGTNRTRGAAVLTGGGVVSTRGAVRGGSPRRGAVVYGTRRRIR